MTASTGKEARPEIGHRGQVVDRVLRGVGHRTTERAGGHVDVGIGEQQPRTAGLARAEIQGMDLAQPALGELFDVDRDDPPIGCGHAVDDVRGAIGGTIVDENDLQLGIVLVQDGAQSRFEGGGLIAGGDDDREPGPDLPRRRVGPRKQRHAANDAQRAREHPKPIDATDEDVSDENAARSHRLLKQPFHGTFCRGPFPNRLPKSLCQGIATQASWARWA